MLDTLLELIRMNIVQFLILLNQNNKKDTYDSSMLILFKGK